MRSSIFRLWNRMLRRIRILVSPFFILPHAQSALKVVPFRSGLTRRLRPSLSTTSITSRLFSSTAAMSGFYSLKAELPNGDVFDFADLKGKTVLIVNIASKWYVALFCMPRPFDSRGNYVTSGFTPQHKGSIPSPVYLRNLLWSYHTGLQALDEKYKDKGLVILGFPCNQVRKCGLLLR